MQDSQDDEPEHQFFAPVSVPPGPQRRTIIVYPHRAKIIGLSALFTSVLLVCLVLTVSLFSSNDIVWQNDEILLVVGVGVLLLAISVGVGWLSWCMISLLLPPAYPVVQITEDGIRVNKIPLHSGFFISWNEIEMIGWATHWFYKYLCIFPKDPDQLLMNFGLLERSLRCSNIWVLGTSFYVPQMYMEQSIEQVLSQISYSYESELRLHNILIAW